MLMTGKFLIIQRLESPKLLKYLRVDKNRTRRSYCRHRPLISWRFGNSLARQMTQSVLSEKHEDSGNDWNNWMFTSVHHWDEDSLGEWTLSIEDQGNGDTGHYLTGN